jgi:hypothetical protein
MHLSFYTICQQSPFKHFEPRTLEHNYNTVKEHGGDCYYDGRRGHCRCKCVLSDKQLKEVEERLQSGELIDVEDVRQEMFPDIPAQTVSCSHL